MNASIANGILTIQIPVKAVPNLSATGKTLSIASSEGPHTTSTLTASQQAEYDRGILVGSIYPNTPVVPFPQAKQLTSLHGLAAGTFKGAIFIWSDENRSVAVSFRP